MASDADVGELKWTPQNLIDEVNRIVSEELEIEGPLAIDEMRGSMTRGVSQPGQPPGIRSGRLSRGLQYKVIRGQRKLIIGVDSSVTYALALEMGAPSIGMRERPFLRPQRARSRARILEKLNKRFK